MNHNDFVNKWLGSKIDFDNANDFQCVDIPKAYASYVLGKTLGTFGGSAWKGYLNGSKTFDSSWQQYGQDGKPQQGDILFFPPTKTNPHGHVSVCHDSQMMLEQNGEKGTGTGEGVDAIRLVKIPKIGGFWRLKGYTPTEDGEYAPQSRKSAIEEVFDDLPQEYRELFSDYTSTNPVTEADCRRLIAIGLFRKP